MKKHDPLLLVNLIYLMPDPKWMYDPICVLLTKEIGDHDGKFNYLLSHFLLTM